MKNIYIILSQTGTLFSKAIRWYTKDPYNHSSISFTSNIEVMYSFGRKKRYNMLDNGFIKESFSSGLYPYFQDAKCCIIEITVTNQEYNEMKQSVDTFNAYQYNYRYNLLGILGYIFGIGMSRKNHYFCSQFVSYILCKSSVWDMTPVLTRPMDFFNIPNKRIVYVGKITEFKGFPLCCISTAS